MESNPPAAPMIVFFVLATALWATLHAWIAWRLAAAFALPSAWTVGALAGGVALSFGWIGAMVAVRGAAGDSALATVRSAVWWYFGFVSVLAAAMVVREVALVGVEAARRVVLAAAAPPDPARRGMLQAATALLAVGGSAGIAAAAVRGGTRLAPVVRVEVEIPGLHPDLDGYRICQITDIHVGQPLTRADLEAIVERTNGVGADLIAVTGDLVDAHVRVLASEVAPIFGLRARDGVFFVTGNHEYYCGAREWTDWLGEGGLRVLTNEHQVITCGQGRLLVGGVTDFTAGQFISADTSDPRRAMAGAPQHDYSLLLAHQPKSLPAAREAGWRLQLSGHTHGGQYAPYTWLVDLFHPVAAGLTRLPGMDVYVSRGTGVWGPPMRLGAPNEITEIVLRRTESSA